MNTYHVGGVSFCGAEHNFLTSGIQEPVLSMWADPNKLRHIAVCCVKQEVAVVREAGVAQSREVFDVTLKVARYPQDSIGVN